MSEDQQFTLSMFAKHVGDSFRIASGQGSAVAVELVEATGRATSGEQGKPSPDARNFSIIFHDSNATPDAHLQQATYRVEHPDVGAWDLFLVPIGPGVGGKGIRYEAVFTSMDSL